MVLRGAGQSQALPDKKPTHKELNFGPQEKRQLVDPITPCQPIWKQAAPRGLWLEGRGTWKVTGGLHSAQLGHRRDFLWPPTGNTAAAGVGWGGPCVKTQAVRLLPDGQVLPWGATSPKRRGDAGPPLPRQGQQEPHRHTGTPEIDKSNVLYLIKID